MVSVFGVVDSEEVETDGSYDVMCMDVVSVGLVVDI